jgi:hypothetical protein
MNDFSVFYVSLETRGEDREYKTCTVIARDFEHCAKLINKQYSGDIWTCEAIRRDSSADFIDGRMMK